MFAVFNGLIFAFILQNNSGRQEFKDRMDRLLVRARPARQRAPPCRPCHPSGPTAPHLSCALLTCTSARTSTTPAKQYGQDSEQSTHAYAHT